MLTILSSSSSSSSSSFLTPCQPSLLLSEPQQSRYYNICRQHSSTSMLLSCLSSSGFVIPLVLTSSSQQPGCSGNQPSSPSRNQVVDDDHHHLHKCISASLFCDLNTASHALIYFTVERLERILAHFWLNLVLLNCEACVCDHTSFYVTFYLLMIKMKRSFPLSWIRHLVTFRLVF